MSTSDDPVWRNALRDLADGSFSALEPMFDPDSTIEDYQCQIVDWYRRGFFDNEPKALAEALSCACFLGRTNVARFLLDKDVDPAEGFGTGMAAFHWAANRGNLEAVRLLIERKAPLEQRNMYDGTVLGCTVWSAINELRFDHLSIIEALLEAGARVEEADYPSGNDKVDELLRRYGAK